MRISKTEAMLLERLAVGENSVKEIAGALNKGIKQVYRCANRLARMDIIKYSQGRLIPAKATHINLLLQLLSENPNLAEVFSDSGIAILTSVIEAKSIAEIARETAFKKTVIYKKINGAKNISLVKKQHNKYRVNKLIWPKAFEFFGELKKYEGAVDARVPVSAEIYFKTEDEIVFSCRGDIDATPTGFSAYGKYGIKILLPTKYYYLPKKNLTKREVFLHSVYVADKDKDLRTLTFITLFYLKYRKELFKVKHTIIGLISRIIAGERIQGFPSLEEIKEKAVMYNIKV